MKRRLWIPLLSLFIPLLTVAGCTNGPPSGADTTPPATPTGLSATAGDGEVTLS